MRYIFKFPDIGEGIHEGRILKWYLEKGQTVRSGDPVVQMETDKVVADIPSPKSGVILARFGNVSEVVKVQDALVEIEVEGEEAKPQDSGQVEEKGFGVVGTIEVASSSAYLPASKEGVLESQAAPARKTKVLATPVARAMAKDFGIDINDVKGTGPAGRVTKSDIQAHHRRSEISAAPTLSPSVQHPEKKGSHADPDPTVEYEPLTQIRKTIAKNMSISKNTAAHMTLTEEAEVSKLVEIRESHKESFAREGVKLTYLSFILKATAESLKKHKSLNSKLDMEGGRILHHLEYHIGIAVDAPDGLVVPVIRDVDRLSILEISRKIGELSERARQRKLDLKEMKGGTFTITNYGSIGGIFGVPVINYPQAAILGVGRIRQVPVVKEGQLAIGTVLPLSLSVDHRIVDGGEATRFINDIVQFLQDPVSLLLIS